MVEFAPNSSFTCKFTPPTLQDILFYDMKIVNQKEVGYSQNFQSRCCLFILDMTGEKNPKKTRKKILVFFIIYFQLYPKMFLSIAIAEFVPSLKVM